MDSRPLEPGHDAHGASFTDPPARGVLATLRPLPTPTDDDLMRLVRIGQLADELANMDDSYDDVPLFEAMHRRHP